MFNSLQILHTLFDFNLQIIQCISSKMYYSYPYFINNETHQKLGGLINSAIQSTFACTFYMPITFLTTGDREINKI